MSRSAFFPRGAEVVLDEAGVLASVRPAAGGGSSYLSGLGGVEVRAGGRRLAWSRPEVGSDVDEVEVTRSSGDLRLVVRHSFTVGWGLRVTLGHAGSAPLELDDVLLAWRVPDDHPVRAVAAGASGSFAVLGTAAGAPVLGGVLRLGSVDRVDEAGLHVGPLVLSPGERYVVSWNLALHDSPRSFERTLPPGVPRRLDVTLDEAVTLAADEDAALVLDEGLHAETVRDRLELTAAAPGRYRVETRSARGVTHHEVRVAETLETTLAQAAATLLAGERTRAGTLRLPGVDAALVLQHALVRGVGTEDQVPAEDALELYGSRLPEEGPVDPRTIAFLCGEHSRTADPEPLDQATRAVLATRRAEPGLGLAATRVCLARLLVGQPVAPVVDHLRGLVAGATDPAMAPAAVPRRAQAALLELELVTAPQAGPVAPAVVARATALGGWLGAGLPGRPVPPLPLDDLGHLGCVLALLPEPVGVELAGRWGSGASELAHRAQVEVLVRLGGASAGPAHGWLALAAGPG